MTLYRPIWRWKLRNAFQDFVCIAVIIGVIAFGLWGVKELAGLVADHIAFGGFK